MRAFVFKIGEKRAGGAVQHAQTGSVGGVLEGAVAAVAVQAVWKPGRLTDVNIVAAIVVEVAGRDAMVSIYVDAARAV